MALRRVSICLGIGGMLLLILLSRALSVLTFGSAEYSSDIALLSVVLLFGAISGGQGALIQGLRRIDDLAKLSVLGAVFGTVLSIPIIYVWGEQGVVPFLIAVGAANIGVSWWYARKIGIARRGLGWADAWTEAGILLKLGVVFMTTTAMAFGVMYLVRVLVIRQLGLEAGGLYQAAFALSIVYIGFILEAMKRDYYPRLTSVAQEHAVCNQLVNEQAEVGFLLSVPVILATLTFAPTILDVLYSAKFIAAYEILRWQILGVLLLVANWPMGFILMAKGKMKVFFGAELLTNAVHLGLTWAGIKYFGLPGAGMAFFGRNVFYTILIFGIVKRMTGFTWSRTNIRLVLVTAPATAIVFLAHHGLPSSWYMVLGGAVSSGLGLYSLKCLSEIVDPDGTRPVLTRIKLAVRRP